MFWRLLCVNLLLECRHCCTPTSHQVSYRYVCCSSHEWDPRWEGMDIDYTWWEHWSFCNPVPVTVFHPSFDEEEGWCIWWLRYSDISFLNFIFEELLYCFILCSVKGIYIAVHCIRCALFKLDCVIPSLLHFDSSLLNTFANCWYSMGTSVFWVYCCAAIASSVDMVALLWHGVSAPSCALSCTITGSFPGIWGFTDLMATSNAFSFITVLVQLNCGSKVDHLQNLGHTTGTMDHYRLLQTTMNHYTIYGVALGLLMQPWIP